ncbi:hypothetical protein MHF_0191 [Mycoplasma haemofelis Ohio2]|uniref:Uncharacterized protein n=1 Tax=Mycoplasma haemofelis (strain Ohio2) TaxID=859194 RepID=F6FG24_MYCHI|nr:hypothetical protein MHF_0191 [Mycoplasma haemofelis Ohio2]
MYIKAKMGIVGVLASLVSGLAGTYFYFTQETDIDRVRSLNLSRATKKGRCKVRINGDQGRVVGGSDLDYNEFYKGHGDKGAVVATSCLKKLTEVDREKEDVVVEVTKGNDGSYVFSKVIIQQQ